VEKSSTCNLTIKSLTKTEMGKKNAKFDPYFEYVKKSENNFSVSIFLEKNAIAFLQNLKLNIL
jgi:hypothetical protein